MCPRLQIFPDSGKRSEFLDHDARETRAFHDEAPHTRASDIKAHVKYFYNFPSNNLIVWDLERAHFSDVTIIEK